MVRTLYNYNYVFNIFKRKISSWLSLEENKSTGGSNGNKEISIDSELEMEILDEHKLFLMSALLLFSTEGIGTQLEGFGSIEKIQTSILTLLQRYLVFRYGHVKAVSQLARSIDVIGMVREAHKIQSRRLPV